MTARSRALLLMSVIAVAAGAAWLVTGGFGPFARIDTSHVARKFLDIPYATASDSQRLDIYHPNEGTPPYPLIIAIHGGGFMMGHARSAELAPMFAGLDRGYAVASINYRLSGEAVFPAAVNDARAAVRFLKANADAYDLDANRIAVWGASAGGNLAAMVGTTASVTALDGDDQEHLDVDASVQAVVNWFGPMDFLAMDAQFAALDIEPALGKTDRDGSPESRYLGNIISSDAALTQRANPATYLAALDPAHAPTFLIQHGTVDANVPVLQSVEFARALTDALGNDKVSLDLIDGAGHGTSEFTDAANLERVFAFLDATLSKDKRER